MEALLLGACARFDRFVLEYFIRRRPTLPPAGLRERLARAAAFYSDRRFIERPGSFFVQPRDPSVETGWRGSRSAAGRRTPRELPIRATLSFMVAMCLL